MYKKVWYAFHIKFILIYHNHNTVTLVNMLHNTGELIPNDLTTTVQKNYINGLPLGGFDGFKWFADAML